MMNIPPSEAAALSLWQYEALLYHWNEAHSTGDDIGPPDHAAAMAVLDRINRTPELIN